MIYFTSDTHFGLQRTLELSKRPFANVGEMDFALLKPFRETIERVISEHCGDSIFPQVLKHRELVKAKMRCFLRRA